jgi:hypothetical protein
MTAPEDRPDDSERAVRLVRAALDDLRMPITATGVEDAHNDILSNARGLLARLAAVERERDELRSSNHSMIRLIREHGDAEVERDEARSQLADTQAELDAARRWQAKRVVAISQDPTCVKWMLEADAAEARLEAVKALAEKWEADDQEHLNTFGQHLPGSVVRFAEMIRAALAGARPMPRPGPRLAEARGVNRSEQIRLMLAYAQQHMPKGWKPGA